MEVKKAVSLELTREAIVGRRRKARQMAALKDNSTSAAGKVCWIIRVDGAV